MPMDRGSISTDNAAPSPLPPSSTPIPSFPTFSSLSRFKNLPPEILSEIFIRCLPQKPSFSPLEAPTSLTRICHDWRTIALNTPLLWSTISVPDWQSLPKGLVQLFTLWLERSAEAGLDLNMTMFDGDVMIVPESDVAKELYATLRGMLEAAAPHRKCVKRFEGVFPRRLMEATKVGEMTNAEIISYFGMLGEVENSMLLDGEEQLEEEEVLDIGPKRQKLVTLVLCGCAARIESVMLQTQLTHLELLDLHRGGNLCQTQAFELLSVLPNLRTCVIDLSRHEREDWTAPAERLIMSHVELLFISWSFPADIATLLNSIAAPKLDKLGLRGTPMVGRIPWSGIYDFLRASNPPLKRISLGDFASVDCQYLQFLPLCTELEHLTLNHCELSDEFFRRLAQTDGTADDTLLPKLEIFNMGVCEGFEKESLTNFLRSRSRVQTDSVSKLREVAIMYCMVARERDVEELEAIGLENLIVEPVDNEATFPFARVIETHRDLIAMLFQNDAQGDENDNPPFAEFSDEEGDDEEVEGQLLDLDEEQTRDRNERENEMDIDMPHDGALDDLDQ